MAIMTQQRLNPASGEQTSADWWGTNAPAATTTQGATLPTSATLGATDQTLQPAAGATQAGATQQWKPGDDPKLFVNQYIQQTQGRAATESDYSYWLPKFEAVGGLGTGEYWMHKMTDPQGQGSNAAAGGANQYGTGSFATAPVVDMATDPGYLERMKLGADAIQGAAAAKGSLLGGGTLKALERYGQTYGSNEYGAMYDRARGAQGDYWQRLQGLYQGGQQATQPTYVKP